MMNAALRYTSRTTLTAMQRGGINHAELRRRHGASAYKVLVEGDQLRWLGHVLRMLVDQKQMTIVLVEQYVDFVREFGHGFYIMDRGRSVAEGTTDDLTADLVRQHLSV